MTTRSLPTGDVTFLFSDIEGSTRLVDALGVAAWTPLLARHRALLREAWIAHGGTEVSTEGDSFFVVFRDPAAAVAAAADAQRSLAAATWPPDAPIHVRIGIHAGDGQLDTDGDYVGHDVHRAARIAGAANGRQVLVSESVVAGLAGRVPPGVSIRALGEHRLKDLRPERIGLLVIDGIAGNDAPIRSLDSRPNNLPTQLTTFVGRERELEEARALLARTRLLTLTGPGGTGKSRLSLQLAASVADRFPDGTWFVGLAAIVDPELFLPFVARVLGVPENPGRTPLDTMVGWLAGKRVLLVVDNMEQLLPAAPRLAELLRELPLLHVVTTSRAPLRIAGEQEYPLDGLPVPVNTAELSPLERAALPEHLQRADPERLRGYEAVRLFLARAAAVKPGFDIGHANAEDIAAIVNHLGGIPLAIELAAARLRFLTPAAIHARLEGRLDLPGTAALDVPERQRTLRGAIAWSHDLLDEPGRRMFARLGVFMDGVDLERVEAVCGPADDLGRDPLDALSALVDQSLVRTDDADGEPRFSLLEPIREFAVEQLERSGEAAAVRDRHAAAYLALVTRAAPFLAGEDQRLWLDRLEQEHANIRAALDWSESRGDAPTALGLAAHAWRFWQKRGYLREARVRVGRLLHQPWAAEPNGLRADVLEAAGGIEYWHGSMATAQPLYEEALAIRRADGDSAAIANACYNLSFCHFIMGTISAEQRAAPLALLEEALERYRALDDTLGMANALWGIGGVFYFSDDNEAAAARLEEALELYRAVGHRTQEAWALHQLGSALLKLGQLDRSRTLMREALRIFSGALDIAGVTLVFEDLSACAVAEGDLVRAARLYGLAKRVETTSGAALATFVEVAFEQLSRMSARSALPPEELERYAAQGRALSLDEGVAYALGELELDATGAPAPAGDAMGGDGRPSPQPA